MQVLRRRRPPREQPARRVGDDGRGARAADAAQRRLAHAAARAEHRRRVGQDPYRTLMQKGQKPPLDYRDSPR